MVFKSKFHAIVLKALFDENLFSGLQVIRVDFNGSAWCLQTNVVVMK